MTSGQLIEILEYVLNVLKQPAASPNTDGWLKAGDLWLKCGDTLLNHYDAAKWCADQGGTLPTKAQGDYLTTLKDDPALAHLFNRGGSFPAGGVWLAEPYTYDSVYAWCQRLSVGDQVFFNRNFVLPALCVLKGFEDGKDAVKANAEPVAWAAINKDGTPGYLAERKDTPFDPKYWMPLYAAPVWANASARAQDGEFPSVQDACEYFDRLPGDVQRILAGYAKEHTAPAPAAGRGA